VIDKVVVMANHDAAAVEARAVVQTRLTFALLAGAGGLMLLVVGGGIVLMSRRIVKPIQAMTGFMGRLAAGDYDSAVPFAGPGRRDRRDGQFGGRVPRGDRRARRRPRSGSPPNATRPRRPRLGTTPNGRPRRRGACRWSRPWARPWLD
jgi:hypothetical protein